MTRQQRDGGISRRRFLQSAGVAASASLLPPWLASAAAATTPITSDQGVLVYLTMAGGNDGLNTFVPVADGAYHDARRFLAFDQSETLHMSDQRGMNPYLPFMKQLWDQGDVAVVDGIGHAHSNLSHFVSMGQIMAANDNGQPGSSGWLGRVLDGMPGEPLTGVALDSSVPLLVQGQHHKAVAVPEHGSDLRQVDRSEPTYTSQYAAIEALGSGQTGLSALGTRMVGSIGQAIGLSDSLRPLVEDKRDEPKVISRLRMAARLINANLGVRVISIIFGDFDSHANQITQHRQRMQEINTGLQAFYNELHDDFASRTLLVSASEFGRRVPANSSGTDHGTANSLFVIGKRVRGGFYGEMPSLTDLDNRKNMKPTVDYRQFYSNIATTWLGADSTEVFGRDYSDLGFLARPGGGTDTPQNTPVVVPTRRTRRAEVARLYLAYFLRRPDDAGFEYWAGVRQSGRSLAQISEEFVGSNEFRMRYGSLSNRQFVELIYQNVLGRSPDSGGLNHWTAVLDGGTSRGDVMIGFSESAEFKTNTSTEVTAIETDGPIGRLYLAYFLRRADEDGLDHWINTGLPTKAISEEFALSTEFRNRYGSLDNAAFVNLIYRNVLGRDPDAGGLAHWTAVLNGGAGRGAVMQEFSDSAEFIERAKTL